MVYGLKLYWRRYVCIFIFHFNNKPMASISSELTLEESGKDRRRDIVD
jgi:hypothetical protein